MPKSCKESKGMSGWVLIGVVSGNNHACKVTSYLQFVKGLVGVRVLQLFELKKLERSPRHFQLSPPSASVYLRIVLFTSDVITLLLCTAGPWHCAFWVEGQWARQRLVYMQRMRQEHICKNARLDRVAILTRYWCVTMRPVMFPRSRVLGFCICNYGRFSSSFFVTHATGARLTSIHSQLRALK